MATEKQVKSRERNWAIHQLRGIYANTYLIEKVERLHSTRMCFIRDLIEISLGAMGAKTHKEQRERSYAETLKIIGKSASHCIVDEVIEGK